MKSRPPDNRPRRGEAARGGREVPSLFGWGVLAAAVALVRNRLWATPNLSTFVLITNNLGHRPDFPTSPAADYLLTNLSLPAIARLLGQTTPNEYARLHLLVLVVGLGTCAGLAYRRFGYVTARTLIVLAAVSPGVTVNMQWLGQPDALFFPLGVAALLVKKRSSLVLVAVLAGLTHADQAIAMVAVAAVARLAIAVVEGRRGAAEDSDPAGVGSTQIWYRSPRWRNAGIELALAWLGVAVARTAIQIYLWAGDIRIDDTRGSYLRLGAGVYWRHHTQSPAQLVYLLWGPLWIVALWTALRLWKADPELRRVHLRPWALLAAAAVVSLVPVAVTLDETRVYAMLTAPLIGAAAVLIAAVPASADEAPFGPPVGRQRPFLAATLALLFAALVIPGGFTAGLASWSLDIDLFEFLRFLASGEHPGPLDLWLLEPFNYVIPI